MPAFLITAWPLLFGMMLLLIGNGLQGTLLGVRGGIEGFSAATMGFVTATYFAGFLAGSYITPRLLTRVGHVRVFAALGSLISAAGILFAELVDPVAWTVLRFMVGISFAGLYIVAESWLNDTATNETRGQALSAYVFVQMVGIIAAQGLINVADPGGYSLFVIMSVLVSVSFMPILLSASPVPMYQSARRMSLKQLFKVSPLGVVGTFLLGGVFACMFGMAPVFGTESGMTPGEVSIFVGVTYVGGMVLMYPLGWISDRMDRRRLITIVALTGAVASIAGMVTSDFWVLTVAMFVIGGTANPLYSLLIAHANDFLEHDDMASASSGLIFLNGLGAVGTPIAVGYVMGWVGPQGFFFFIGGLLGGMGAYAVYRSTVRSAPDYAETGSAILVGPQPTAYIAEWAQEYAVHEAETTEDDVEAEHGPEHGPDDAAKTGPA